MQEFINKKMNEIYEDFNRNLKEEKQYCVLKKFRFDGNNIPDYKNEILQQYYLLKYLPAYFAEYYYIYLKVIDSNFLVNNFNILSIGCGSGIDLWSIHYAIKNLKCDKKIRYTGLDIIEWEYWDDCSEESYFIEQDVNDLIRLDENKYNIIVFPKSIGEFSLNSFNSLKEAINNTDFTSERIILIVSMRIKRVYSDLERVKNIVSIFEDLGYIVKERKWTKFKKKEIKKDITFNYKIKDIIPDLEYPKYIEKSMSEFYKKCEGYTNNGDECCTESCEEIFKRKPITTMSQVAYTIVKLERRE